MKYEKVKFNNNPKLELELESIFKNESKVDAIGVNLLTSLDKAICMVDDLLLKIGE